MPAEALGHQPYITCHLAWEPTPPTRSLGKARPRPEGGGQDWADGSVAISQADTGAWPCPTEQLPTPDPWEGWGRHWPILQARTPRVSETPQLKKDVGWGAA